ncbi:hypothetical protein [Winogradskyella sp. SYSU M77433]|uniref:hypothetical protein n=1 Tax=Winogradskyella sp. SYSU M77433 TaxID=3042722 RepID=UPI0024801252|nr:hypothetical protein [Winogradskyella sp. SYSU M77433]MDH7911345.1 hypothetical protein [Winogradskyella sp. SYSU M77433]
MSNSTDSLFYKYNPEKRNIFIEIHSSRNNTALEFFSSFFMLFASHASAIVEVFLRRRFGERYITLAQSIGLFIVINVAYGFLDKWFRLKGGGTFLFLFSVGFLVMAIIHRLEIKKYGTTYDFKRFSLSDGEIAPFWWELIGNKFLGVQISSYHVRVLLEPALPIFIGGLLSFFEFSKAVGIILIFCGFVYGVRNFVKAQKGRNWVLDNIDKKISNEMKYDVFIRRKSKKDTKGVYLPIELPEDKQTRTALYNAVNSSMSDTKDVWVNDFLDEDHKSTGLNENIESTGGGNG